MKKFILSIIFMIGITGIGFAQSPVYQTIMAFDNTTDLNNYNYSWLDDAPRLAIVYADSTMYYWSSGLSAWRNLNTPADSIPYITGAGTPVGSVTPNSVGEHYQDLVTGIIWVSDGITNANWERDLIESDGEVFILGTINLDGAATIGAGQDDYVLKYDHSTQKWGPEPDAGASGGANLSLTTKTATTFDIESDSGTNVTLPESTNTEAGLMSAAQDTKLDGIDTGAADDQVLTAGYGIDLSGSPDYTIEADTSEMATQYDISGFGNDESTTNELQDLTLSTNILSISDDPTPGATIDLSPYLDNTNLSQEQVEDYAGDLISNGTGTHTGITVTYQDGTGDVDFVVDHDAATNFDIAEHRIINDSGTSATELWSADKISTEIAAVSAGAGQNNTMDIIGTASGHNIYHSKVASELKVKGIDSLDATIVIVDDPAGDDILIGVNEITSTHVTDFDTEVGNHPDVVDAVTHITSTGADHTWINQNVASGESPTFVGTNFTNISADDVNIVDAGGYYTATEVEGALQEIRPLVNTNTLKVSYPGSADATELNILDGATITTTELNKLGGLTATTAELNYVDGVTSSIQNQLNNKLGDLVEDTSPQLGGNLDLQTWNIEGVDATEIAILDGATLSTTELNYVDGVTSGIQDQLNTKLGDVIDDVSPQLGGNLDLNGNNLDNVSPTELAILDGASVTTAELNKLDGVTATTGELNILDGVTSTASELNVLDGVPGTLTATELGYSDGVTSSIQDQLDDKADAVKDVNAKGGSYTLTAAESGEIFYTTSAADYTLPTPAYGLTYTIISDYSASITVRIKCGDTANDVIEWASDATDNGLNIYLSSNGVRGAAVTLTCVNESSNAVWHVTSATSTWVKAAGP